MYYEGEINGLPKIFYFNADFFWPLFFFVHPAGYLDR